MKNKDYHTNVLKTYLESLSAKYGISISKIGEEAGFHDSTFRRWKTGSLKTDNLNMMLHHDCIK